MGTTVMYILPGDFWNEASDKTLMRSLLREVVVLRRRIAKGANADAERSRYSSCLSELEGNLLNTAAVAGPVSAAAAAKAARGDRPVGFSLPAQYFDLLARAHWDRVERLGLLDATAGIPAGAEPGASVFAPGVLSAHADELDKLAVGPALEGLDDLRRLASERASIVRAVAEADAGIVEVLEELDKRDAGALPPPAERSAQPVAVPAEPDVAISAKGRKRMAERLRQSIESALQGGGSVNFSDQPHEVSTEILAEAIYTEPGGTARKVRVVYADGSEARPFPLRFIGPPSPATETTAEPIGDGIVEISAALMSMRHLELDPFVDRAWYRNKEVSVTRPLAESDEFCFQHSMRELAEMREVYAGCRVLIRMFHTGFEPAAVGFYRAVATELQDHRGWLLVLPHYFRGGSRFETGRRVWE